MLKGNQISKAMLEVNPGLADSMKKKKKKKGKVFQCHKCGTDMVKPDETNIMYCPDCDESYFIFDKN